MGLDYLTDSLRIKSYAATPRVFTLGWERNEAEETDAMSFDLGRNRMGGLAARLPAGAWDAVVPAVRLSLLFAARLLLVVVWL